MTSSMLNLLSFPSNSRVLLIAVGNVIPHSELTHFITRVRAQVAPGVADFEQLDRISSIHLSKSKYHRIVILSPVPTSSLSTFSTSEPFSKLLRIFLDSLLVNGEIRFYIDQRRWKEPALLSLMKRQGFVNVSSQIGNEDTVEVVAFKPDYEVGSAAPVLLRKRQSTQNDSNPKSVKPNSTPPLTPPITLSKDEAQALWTNDAQQGDLEDENDLIEEDDWKKPATSTLGLKEGEVIKKKACANCTCGLAELEQEEKKQNKNKVTIENGEMDTSAVTSSCGSCYLGDAFRCSSCPYRGLPPFQPGEKVAIPDSMLDNDF